MAVQERVHQVSRTPLVELECCWCSDIFPVCTLTGCFAHNRPPLTGARPNRADVPQPLTGVLLRLPTPTCCNRWQADEYGGAYIVTELGKATATAGLDPKQALDVRDDLERARQGFCMATDLHLTFLVTPVQEELPVNWQLWVPYSDSSSSSSTCASVAVSFACPGSGSRAWPICPHHTCCGRFCDSGQLHSGLDVCHT